jgi:transcriptional regulator with XRE-family HTH domain
MPKSALVESAGTYTVRRVAHWSDEKFRARVTARAAELGLSLKEVLARAGVAEDYLRRKPGKQGRGVLNIEAIARACNWTIAQALGFIREETGGPIRPDKRKLRLALEAADRTIGTNVEREARLDVLVEFQAHAYDLLSAWEGRTGPLSDEQALALVEEVLSLEFSSGRWRRSGVRNAGSPSGSGK